MATKILIVDDDEAVYSQLENAPLKNGYAFIKARNGDEGLELALREEPALVILETILPRLDGFTLCKELRNKGYKNPIVFLTNKTSESDAVTGLELGAQDYIRKPIQVKELLLRIDVQLKKNQSNGHNKTIVVSDLEIDLERRRIKHKGEIKELTHKEFQLLYALAQCPNKVFSRGELLNSVWGWPELSQTRTVDIHIGYLRKKFEEDPKKPKILQTIRGLGYTLNTEF